MILTALLGLSIVRTSSVRTRLCQATLFAWQSRFVGFQGSDSWMSAVVLGQGGFPGVGGGRLPEDRCGRGQRAQ